MPGKFEGARVLPMEDRSPLVLSRDVRVLIGTTETLITRPGDVGILTVLVTNGLFLARPGDYRAKTFTAATSDVCTSAGHGYLTGDGPFRLRNSGGALPGGLAAGTDYYVIRLDADTFKLASSMANATATVPIAIDVTSAGSGTHTIGGIPVLATASSVHGYESIPFGAGAWHLSAPQRLTLAGTTPADSAVYWFA